MLLYNTTMFFLADGVTISTRQSDNSGKISFSTGEYQLDQLMDTFKQANNLILAGKSVKVTIEEE